MRIRLARRRQKMNVGGAAWLSFQNNFVDYKTKRYFVMALAGACKQAYQLMMVTTRLSLPAEEARNNRQTQSARIVFKKSSARSCHFSTFPKCTTCFPATYTSDSRASGLEKTIASNKQ